MTLTFLFTDIEGSTKLWERHSEKMDRALACHDEILRANIGQNSGQIFKKGGDSFCAVFSNAPDAIRAALAVQRSLGSAEAGLPVPLSVRMAIHTGVATSRDGDYFGPPLNKVARLLGVGHGGQVLISLACAELVRDSLPEDARLIDLGAHSLRDLQRSEHIFQLAAPGMETHFPPLRVLNATPNNLPVQATRFIGRELELRRIREGIIRPEVRLLTLLGPGGTGKTRLAVQAAADLQDEFEDGIFFVPLASVTDADLVAHTIVNVFGLKTTGGSSLTETLADYLREKRLLLLLDNFEQVVAAAPLIGKLLASCSHLKVIATSRSILGVYGEREYPVLPLRLPDLEPLADLETLGRNEAVWLFVERAQAIRPTFGLTEENAPVIAEICHRLDGLPLAIELAAARVRLFSPQALLSKLGQRLPFLTAGVRDLPYRQQTLRGAIAWSYELLDSNDRKLFAMLGVFAGGFALEAAQEICGGVENANLDVLEGIASLVSQSLLRTEQDTADEPRTSMLETIREFALEQLESFGLAADLRKRHAEYYLHLARQAEPYLTSRLRRAWLQRLEPESDNLRTALQASPEIGLQVAGTLLWYWNFRGSLQEGREWLTKLLASSAGGVADRAKALYALGSLAYYQGQSQAARAALQESVALWREADHRPGLAHALCHLCAASVASGEREEALLYAREAAALFRQSGDTWGTAYSLFYLGYVTMDTGDLVGARSTFGESLSLAEFLGDPWVAGGPLLYLGSLLEREGNWAEAAEYYRRSLAIVREEGDRFRLGIVLATLGRLLWRQQDYTRAWEHFQEYVKLCREIGNPAGIAAGLRGLGAVARAQGDYERASKLLRESLQLASSPRVNGAPLTLAILAGLAADQAQPVRAARLLGSVEAHVSGLGFKPGVSIWLQATVDWAEDVSTTRAQLGDASFQAAWNEGKNTSLNAAIKLALSEPP